MNTRQQRYFLLAIILLSFLLLGQIGGEDCEECFGIVDESDKRSISSLDNVYYDIDVKINEIPVGVPADEFEAALRLHLCSGGTVTPMEARVVERTGVATFTVTLGGCKSMSVHVLGALGTPLRSPRSVVGTTITVGDADIDLDLIVIFFDDCTGKYPFSDDCEAPSGGTPLITDGEPVNPIPKPPEPEPEPVGPPPPVYVPPYVPPLP